MGRTSNAKEKLLDVAFELIWDHSFGSVSVDQICERAGVKKGSFYHFFSSKVDLTIAAYDEHWRQKQPGLDRMFSPQVPPLERLSSWCEHIYKGQKEKAQQFGHVCGCPYSSIGGEIATQDDRMRSKCEEIVGRMSKYVESAIEDARREGLAGCENARAATKQVQSYVMGALLQAKIQNDVEVLKNLEPTVFTMIGATKRQ